MNEPIKLVTLDHSSGSPVVCINCVCVMIIIKLDAYRYMYMDDD